MDADDNLSRRPALLVFADDWGRHPSSCQHLIQRFLGRYQVCWVNTIGTRTPRLNWSTVVRGFEKIRHWFATPPVTDRLPDGLRVVNPKMWPWLSSAFDRRLNRRLLLKQLTPIVEALPSPVHAITTLPVVADLMGSLPVARWIYYCVDDFSLWPGLDQRAMASLEDQVISRADAVVAVSANLRDKLLQRRPSVELLTHGVDWNFWRMPGSGTVPALTGLEAPFIVFWGVIDRRMDIAWLAHLCGVLKKGTVVLAGPEAEPDPALAKLPRVVRVGSVPYDDLPALARQADVLVMPYADLPVTRAMQPLKLKEYLATGRPTVARNLPANLAWHDALDLVDSAETFTRMVVERMATGLPTTQALARERLREESWEHKARLLEKWALAPAG